MYCWGYSLLGRLGDGTGAGTEEDPEASVDTPTLIDAAGTFIAVAAGAAHACAIAQDGALWCWGDAGDGRLGHAAGDAPDTCMLSDTPIACALSPLAVDDGGNYAQLCVGGAHGCAIDDAARLWCWGSNAYGELGVGDSDARATPSEVGEGFTAIACGGEHSCAIDESEALRCFGDGTSDQLGTGDDGLDAPTASVDGAPWTSVAAGALASCAIDSSNDGYCWGFSAVVEASSPRRVFPVNM